MHNQRIQWLGLALFVVAGSCVAAGTTITVNTNLDEKNPNQNSVNGPKNAGCSLREAILVIDSGNNVTYPQCADPSPGAPFIIDVTGAGGTIVINGLVLDPTVPSGMPKIRNQTMPNIFAVGTVAVMGGDITCAPAPDSEKIFSVAANGDFTLSGVTIHDCTAFGQGIAVSSDASGGSANLTLTGTNFTAIHATGGGVGGAVAHGSGTLTVSGGAFSNCSQDDSAGGGRGGALAIGGVSFPNTVTLNGLSFLNNSAGQNGGAIYINGADSITMNSLIFTANSANGDSGNNAENGGGAIWAGSTATGGLPTSFFLIFNGQFISNSAPNGTGGAIVLTGGNLSYGNFDFSNPKIPGGIVASNFTGNSAGGPAPTGNDPRSGSGGAIYASGNLTIEQSSFVATLGANSSSHGSGGAIALYDASGSLSPMALTNVTINGSTAGQNGGAIANLLGTTNNAAKITLINDTLDGNSATGTGGTVGGGALFNGNTMAAGVKASNTIFSNSTGVGGNCAGQPFNSAATDTNLQFSGTTCGAAITNADPKLNSPGIFAGPNLFVFTMSLNAGSAASGTGTNSVCNGAPVLTFDGTGTPLTRPSPGGSNCDIGAFESSIAPDLTIAKSHTDPFTQGNIGDTYTITVTNSGTTSTSGAVTVTDTLPAGLAATAIAGTGWICQALPVLSCSRSDVLANGASYPVITLTVDVAANASAQVTNTATVAGGGEVVTNNDTANDLTNITPKTTPVTLQSFEVD